MEVEKGVLRSRLELRRGKHLYAFDPCGFTNNEGNGEHAILFVDNIGIAEKQIYFHAMH